MSNAHRLVWWISLVLVSTSACPRHAAAADGEAEAPPRPVKHGETPSNRPGSDAGEVTADPHAATLTAKARELFVRGTRLAKQGQWHEALDAFEQSAELRSHAVSTYNIAYCERALGRYTRSWISFTRALEEHASPDGGELPPDLLRSARVYRPEVEQKLARATVRVPPDARLAVDERPLEPLEEGLLAAGTRERGAPEGVSVETFELVADAGEHTFLLTKAGSPETVVRRALSVGDNGTIVLELGEARPAEAEPVTARPPARSSSPVTEPPPDGSGRGFAWPMTAYGVGAAGLTVGTVFGIRTLQTKSDLDCSERQCSRDQSAELHGAKRDARISTVGFVVGAAGAGVGTLLLLTGGNSDDEDELAVEPWLGVGSVGARGRF